MNLHQCSDGSVENDQHQKMITIVHSENDHHIYFGNNFEENDHHGKVKKMIVFHSIPWSFYPLAYIGVNKPHPT